MVGSVECSRVFSDCRVMKVLILVLLCCMGKMMLWVGCW